MASVPHLTEPLLSAKVVHVILAGIALMCMLIRMLSLCFLYSTHNIQQYNCYYYGALLVTYSIRDVYSVLTLQPPYLCRETAWKLP
jgi:hypothetical protein